MIALAPIADLIDMNKLIVFKIILAPFFLFPIDHLDELLDYVQNKSEIREGGSSVYNYEGLTYVVSVASVVVGNKTEQSCKTAGSAKAKKEMLAYINGSEISSYTELSTAETVSETLEGTMFEAKQEYIEVIRERVLGMINQTVPLGGWYSDDRSVYYYAIYRIVE